jgi:hypothetical protein
MMGSPAKMYVARVFVDVDHRPNEVVTAYGRARSRSSRSGSPWWKSRGTRAGDTRDSVAAPV